jgi:Tol biopolymer transport system component
MLIMFVSLAAAEARAGSTLTVNTSDDRNRTDARLSLREAILLGDGKMNRCFTNGERAQVNPNNTWAGNDLGDFTKPYAERGCWSATLASPVGVRDADQINFTNDVSTINVGSGSGNLFLPVLGRNDNVNGRRPDASRVTLDGSNAQFTISGDTHYAGGGLEIAPPTFVDGQGVVTSGSRIVNLVIRNFGANGIVAEGAQGAILQNLEIHNCAGGISLSYGTYREGDSPTRYFNPRNNLIGGSAAGERNHIYDNGTSSLNGVGISIIAFSGERNACSGDTIDASDLNNRIENNYIGLDPAGNTDRGNTGDGILLRHAWGNTIGGDSTAQRNVISGNGGNGIHITNPFSSSCEGSHTRGRNKIRSNFIGTSHDGNTRIGNTQNGIRISDHTHDNEIGANGFGNVIAGNFSSGVFIQNVARTSIKGNFIGTNASRSGGINNSTNGIFLLGAATASSIDGNTILNNGLAGIRISDPGTNDHNIYNNIIGGADASGNLRPNSVGVLIRNSASNNYIGSGNQIAANTTHGIHITGAGTTGNRVFGNTIGLDYAGAARGNGGNGVLIEAGAQGNQIGAADTISGANGAGNTISANANDGISIKDPGTNNNAVYGNTIGLTQNAGDRRSNSASGIAILNGAQSNIIGGTLAGEANYIAANNFGVFIADANTDLNLVQGNLIGTYLSVFPFGNAASGIHITANASRNIIGGFSSAAQNQIGYNGGDGIWIASGTGNEIRRNAIGYNGELGIDLGADGVNANDADDADTGANNLQNFPVLTSALVANNTTRIRGTFSGVPGRTFALGFYSSPACDASGYGEGLTYLAVVGVTTDDKGMATIDFTLPAAVQAGHAITARATTTGAPFDTSEFSPCATVANPSQSGELSFSAPSFIASEPDGTGTLTVRRALGTTGTVTVNYIVSNNTAVEGADYTSASGTLTFVGGDAEEKINIALIADNIPEGGETLSVTLSNPTGGATLGAQKSAVLTIYDTMLQAPGNWIAFESFRNSNADIYLMRPDGSQVSRLTIAPERDDHPTFSPDGTRVAFTRRNATTNLTELRIVSADGSEMLVGGTSGVGFISDPAWSPDGARLAFVGGATIYTIRTDGTDRRQINYCSCYASSPAWSPDGSRIAYDRDNNRDGEHEIYVADADGTNETRLTTRPGFDGQPAFSSDGARIAYVSRRDGTSNNFDEVFTMNVDGSNPMRLTNNAAADYNPAWSPDASRLAFVSTRDDGFDIFTMNHDGTSQTRVTASPEEDSAPAWRSTEVVLTPIADTYVQGATAFLDTNFGASTEMQVKRTFNPGAGRGRRAFLKFDTASHTGTIGNARLRLFARLSDPSLANVPMRVQKVADTSWDELAVTWNTQPAVASPTALAPDIVIANDTGAWYEFDLTAFVNAERAAGRSVVSFRLINMLPTGTSGAYYTSVNSREAANKPRLVITP